MIHLNTPFLRVYDLDSPSDPLDLVPEGTVFDHETGHYLLPTGPFVSETGHSPDSGPPDAALEPAVGLAYRLCDVEPEPRLIVRCTSEYRDWAEGLAAHLGGLTTTQTLCQGLIRLAEASGYSTRIPIRYQTRRKRRVPLVERVARRSAAKVI